MISMTYANKLLDAIVGNGAISQPSAVYLGLCETEPSHSTGAVTSEPSASSYARKDVTGDFAQAAGGIVRNKEELHLDVARTAFGKVNYWFLSTSEDKGGEAMIWGEINNGAGVDIGAETVPVFYEGELKASIDVALT